MSAAVALMLEGNWADWCTAADTGAQLLWRVKSGLTLPVLALLPDGSYSSVLVNPKVRGKAREALLEAARGREDLDEDQARYVRVVEYEVPDRDGDGKGEVIALVTTITQMTAAPAPLLAEAYHQRWEHETGNAQLKTSLRGPGRVLRSRSPDMVRQEKFRSAIRSQSSSSLRYSLRASDCSPAPLPATPPIAASATTCEAHSLTVTTRTFGNAGRSGSSAPVPANPKAAAFSGVSGASHSKPSMAISRHGPRNAPAVSSSATGAATSANSAFSGSYPSRWRAWVIPPDVGTLHESSQQPHAVSVSVSRAATSS